MNGGAPIIIIDRGLWGQRCEVAVEPPQAAYPLGTFRTHDEALARAEQIHEATGWAILDRGLPGGVA